MDLKQALEILGHLGSNTPPTLVQLKTARATVARELHRLKGSGDVDLDALVTLRETYTVADQAVEAAEAAEAEVASEVESVLDGVPNPDDEDGDEDGEEDDEDGDEDGEEKAVSAKVLSLNEAVERLGLTGFKATDREAAPENDLAATSTRVQIGDREATEASWDDLASAFRDAGRSLKVGKERVARIETEFASERTLPGKTAENTRMLDSFVGVDAVVAAGGCCSLPEPIYTNPVYSVSNRPIKASLPTLGASRGKVTFYPAICLPQDGVGLWSCEDDAAVDPEDQETWKQCAEVECDEAEDAEVEAIYTCLTIGNYQHRFASEQWRGALQALAAQQARVAEASLFSKMRANTSTTHTVDAYGSTYTNLLNGVGLAVSTIRQSQRLGNTRFNLWLPEWILSAIRAEFRARRVYSSAVALPGDRERCSRPERVLHLLGRWHPGPGNRDPRPRPQPAEQVGCLR